MYIVKNPWIGGEAIPHQDWIYQITTPDTVWGIWIAIDDATIENGCLWALKGLNNYVPVKYFMKKKKNSKGEEEIYYEGTWPDYDVSGGVPIEVPKGSAVLLHSDNVHYAPPNLSNRSRHAFTIHFMDSAVSKWEPDNWLQRTSKNPFRWLY